MKRDTYTSETEEGAQNETLHIWKINLQQAAKSSQWETEWSFQQVVLEKLNKPRKNNEIRPLSYTTHKNGIEMDQRLKNI